MYMYMCVCSCVYARVQDGHTRVRVKIVEVDGGTSRTKWV